MRTRLIILAVIVVAAAAAFFALRDTPRPQTVADVRTYTSVEGGISFTYPSLYEVKERGDSFGGAPIRVMTLTDASVAVPDMSEGPTAISVIEIPNASSTPLEEWIKRSSISNFYLSPDKALASTSVAGAQALSYRFSGLYENDAVAAEHNGKVYLFFASWMNANDRIRADFKSTLSSVTFTP